MKLFSYTLRYDDGAAPNPFWGVCTLAVRRPAIRLAAEVDDWIVGLGPANSPIGDISDRVTYAMKVTSKMTFEEYDQFCKTFVPKKKPDWRSIDYRLRMGDCIYNYTAGPTPKMRTGIHTEENQGKDLSGSYVLVSKQFYYFGKKPVKLPDELRPIMYAEQGHQSDANQDYVEPFVNWIENLDQRPNKASADPQRKVELMNEKEIQAIISKRDLAEDE
jgi:hypothetical protein